MFAACASVKWGRREREIGSHSCGILQCLLVTLSWSQMDESKLQTISSPLLYISTVAARHLQWNFTERNVGHNAPDIKPMGRELIGERPV